MNGSPGTVLIGVDGGGSGCRAAVIFLVSAGGSPCEGAETGLGRPMWRQIPTRPSDMLPGPAGSALGGALRLAACEAGATIEVTL